MDAVRRREVDDAELAAEVHRGLAAMVCEPFQARSAPAGQHDGHRSTDQLARSNRTFHRRTSLGQV